jgi:hypothetical protein
MARERSKKREFDGSLETFELQLLPGLMDLKQFKDSDEQVSVEIMRKIIFIKFISKSAERLGEEIMG